MTSLRSMVRRYVDRCIAYGVRSFGVEDIHPDGPVVFFRVWNRRVPVTIGQPGRDKALVLKAMTDKALADLAAGATRAQVLERLFEGAYDVDAREECAIMEATNPVRD